MPVKRIVCLANSHKFNERCVAGKVIHGYDTGIWIRPVSNRKGGAISAGERQYRRGGEPQLRDVVDIAVLEPRPENHQTENWLLDPAQRWRRDGRINWRDLLPLVDPVQPLWVDGYSTNRGMNDEIPIARIGAVRDSLRFIHVQAFTLIIGEYHGRKLWGRFVHARTEYILRVTDPAYIESYETTGNGEYVLGECLLTLSIGEPFAERNACYKLIAGIMNRP